MAMDAPARADFIDAYTHLLITAWSSEEFTSRLGADAKAALRECGIEVPEIASVELVRTIPEGESRSVGSLDNQLAAWEEGARTGRYQLFVPDVPQLTEGDLTEGDLDGISAQTSYSCCCPCCSSLSVE